MDVSKTIKAAKSLQGVNPALANEIMRIAQDFQGDLNAIPSVSTQSDDQGVQSPDTSSVDSPPVDASQQGNPGIKNYIAPQAGATETHRVTIDMEVPTKTPEDEIFRAVYEAASTFEQKGYGLKGYSFTKTSRN